MDKQLIFFGEPSRIYFSECLCTHGGTTAARDWARKLPHGKKTNPRAGSSAAPPQLFRTHWRPRWSGTGTRYLESAPGAVGEKVFGRELLQQKTLGHMLDHHHHLKITGCDEGVSDMPARWCYHCLCLPKTLFRKVQQLQWKNKREIQHVVQQIIQDWPEIWCLQFKLLQWTGNPHIVSFVISHCWSFFFSSVLTPSLVSTYLIFSLINFSPFFLLSSDMLSICC